MVDPLLWLAKEISWLLIGKLHFPPFLGNLSFPPVLVPFLPLTLGVERPPTCFDRDPYIIHLNIAL